MSGVIPTRPDLDNYVETVSLDGVDYDLNFFWNERDLQWYANVYLAATSVNEDGSRAAIAAGLPVLIGAPLMLSVTGRARPAGEITPLDTSNKDIEAGQRDLGIRVLMGYLSQADLIAAGVN